MLSGVDHFHSSTSVSKSCHHTEPSWCSSSEIIELYPYILGKVTEVCNGLEKGMKAVHLHTCKHIELCKPSPITMATDNILGIVKPMQRGQYHN